jgi:hypothetical protein
MRTEWSSWADRLRVAAALALAAGVVACSEGAPIDPGGGVTGLLAVVGPDTVLPAEAATFEARAGGRAVTDAVWSSSDASVLTPSTPPGLFQARSEGVVRIIAVAGGQRAEKDVVVRARPPVVPEPRPALELTSADSTFRSVGDTVAVRAMLRYPSGDSVVPTEVVWSTANAAIATVQAGKVVAQQNGRVLIEARVGTAHAALELTVAQRPVSLTTSAPSFEIAAPGGSLQASAAARDARGNPIPGQSFTWSSSHPSRIAVDATGRLTAPAYGSARITVRSGDLTRTVPARVLGGGAPRLESPRLGITAVGADPLASYVVLEFGLRDTERDMDSLRVALLDAGGAVLYELETELRQGVEAEPFWVHAAKAERAVNVRIDVVDAAGNRLSQTLPLKRSPGAGAPVVEAVSIERIGTDSVSVEIAGLDMERDVRAIWLVGFNDSGGWTMVERFDFPAVEWVDWLGAFGTRGPGVAQTREWGVILSDQAGNLSRMYVWKPGGVSPDVPLQLLRTGRQEPVSGGARPSRPVRVRPAGR